MKKPIIAFATAILILASCGESKSFAYSGEPGMELSNKDEWYNSFCHWNDVTADISTSTSYYVASGSERDDYEVGSESTFKINWRGEADIEVTTTSNGTTSTTEAYVRSDGQQQVFDGSVLDTDSFDAYEDLYDDAAYQEGGYYLVSLPEENKPDFFSSLLGALSGLPGYTFEYDFSKMDIKVAIAFGKDDDGQTRPVYIQEWAVGEMVIHASAFGQSADLTYGIKELQHVRKIRKTFFILRRAYMFHSNVGIVYMAAQYFVHP